LRRMKAGDPRGAIEVFERIRASGPDGPSALLEGICRYELREDAHAAALLREAERDSALAPSARLFLGLISLREGAGEQAARSFESAAASDPALSTTATSLLQIARREGPLVLSMLVGSSADSNVDLAPDGAPTPGGSGDGAGTAALLVLFRPSGESGPFARASGTYRKLGRFSAFDLGAIEGSTGWQVGHEARHLLAGYDYDFLALGGTGWLSAHRLYGDARWTAGQISFSARYAVRFESFLTADAQPYSGLRHTGQAGAEWRFEGGSAVGLEYVGVRDVAADPALTYLEHGPRLSARIAATRTLRFMADADLLRRTYDVFDSTLGLSRADLYLDAGAAAELDFADRWTARVWAAGRRSLSNAADFAYLQISGGVTLSVVVGLL